MHFSLFAARGAGRSLGSALWVTALALGVASLPTQAAWFADGTLESSYDSNPALAETAADIEGEMAVGARVSGGWYQQLTDRIGLSATADVAGEHHAQFTGLDYVGIGGSVSLRGKLGLGVDAPWWKLGGNLMARDYDFDLRDGLHYGASASVGKRIVERLSVDIKYAYDGRRSDETVDVPIVVQQFGIGGGAFDFDGDTFSLGATYDFTQRFAVSARYAHRWGLVCSSTRRNRAALLLSTAVNVDPVFGVDRVAYTGPAETDFYTINFSYALGDHASLNAGYEYRDALFAEEFSYDGHVARVSVRYSF